MGKRPTDGSAWTQFLLRAAYDTKDDGNVYTILKQVAQTLVGVLYRGLDS